MSVNRVELLGNLARDPEVKEFSNGGGVVNLTVVTSIRWFSKKDNDWAEKATFIPVQIDGGWENKRLETIPKALNKGDQVYLEGRYDVRVVERDDEKKFYTSVRVTPRHHIERTKRCSDGNSSKGDNEKTPDKKEAQVKSSSEPKEGSPLDDDEIPF